MLSDRVARDRDKEFTLSGGHVSSLRENEKPSDETLPFYLPPSVKVRSDGTILPPTSTQQEA